MLDFEGGAIREAWLASFEIRRCLHQLAPSSSEAFRNALQLAVGHVFSLSRTSQCCMFAQASWLCQPRRPAQTPRDSGLAMGKLCLSGFFYLLKLERFHAAKI